MKHLRWVPILMLLLAGGLFAQIPLPDSGLVGHWKFDDAANLNLATVGNDLVQGQVSGGTIEIVAATGPEAGNGAVNVAIGSFFRATHDIEANGFDPALQDSVPSRVNRFSLVVDFRLAAGSGVWYAFHAANNGSDPVHSDWESFIRPNGQLGITPTGYSHYLLLDTEGWYRLVITVDLGVAYNYYLDGQLVQEGGKFSLDNRFSLDSPDASNQILLIGDNDSEDAAMDVAEIALYDRPLTAEEIDAMSGYGHLTDLGTPVAKWTFDDQANPLHADKGVDLTLVGNHSTIAGPEATDNAVNIGVGSHYIATHDISVRGFDANSTKVNRYTISMDIRIPSLGPFYALMQANAANIDNAELMIDSEGHVGSPEIGWTTGTIKAGEWYRILMAVSLGDTLPNVVVYLDGDSVLTSATQASDGDYALAPRSGGNQVLFLADENGEDNSIDVARIAIFNRQLDTVDARGEGGFEHVFSTEDTPAKMTHVYRVTDATQYVRVPYSEDFDIPLGRSFTIECWIQIGSGILSDPAFISNKDWDSGGNNGWNLAAKASSWDFNIADTNRERTDFDPPSLNDGRWHHVAIIIDGAARTAHVLTDDLLQGPEPLPAGPTTNVDQFPLCFAQDGTEGYPQKFPGSLDEVRIWHAALSYETLRTWRHKEVTAGHPDFNALVGYWKFDETEGDMVMDLSGRGHHGTIINNPSRKISYAVLGDATAQGQEDLVAIWDIPDTRENTSAEMTIRSDFVSPGLLAKKAPQVDSQGKILTQFFEQKYAGIGHNGQEGITDADIGGSVVARQERIWYFDATETFEGVGIDVDFKLSVPAGVAGNYVLLTRQGTSGEFNEAAVATSVSDAVVSFVAVTPSDASYYTLGTTDASASPIDFATSVEIGATPLTFSLHNNYPNPFNPETTIEYSIANISDVKLTVFNALGQQIATIVDVKKQAAGRYKVTWAPTGVSTGVYFYRIDAGEFVKIHKMILLK